MKYSYSWLQSHIKETLPPVESLKETIIFHAFEVESIEVVGDDTVLDIKVLPDRAGDAFSHYGMAREIAGLLKLTLKPLEVSELPKDEVSLPIEVNSDLCRRYMAIQIDGVKVGPSPDWLKERLEAVGQKSINNVVDATNFVMFDLGQPTHAFDKAKIDGGVIVRLAKENEHMITLSGEEKTFTQDMLLITDYVGALGIAGVKGGKLAEVANDTTSLVLEIANFDPTSVRRTSRSLNLITDASKRFENNFSSEVASAAGAMLAKIIVSVAGGTIIGVYDHYPKPQETKTILFETNEIAKQLGDWVTTEKIKKVFDAYQYVYEEKDGTFTFTVPFWRQDIIGAHDIVEEVGRVIGYDTIEAKPLPFTPSVEINPTDQLITTVKKYLVEKGFSEVFTYTFRKRGEWYVARGPKDKSALRSNLSEGLKESFDLNKRNMPLLGLSKLKLFEIGTVFLSDREEIHVATVDDGIFVELPIDQFVQQQGIVLDSNPIDLSVDSTENRFRMWSIYPFIVRDVAVWLPAGDSDAKETLDTVMKVFAQKNNLKTPIMFDSFQKDERISYAYRFIFQSFDHTLSDDEVAKIIAPLMNEISAINGAEAR